MKDNKSNKGIEAAAQSYIDDFERFVSTQCTMLELTSDEVGNNKVKIDPTVWEAIGKAVLLRHGQEAHSTLPLIMLATDIYLYKVGKLSDEHFLDAVNSIDEYITQLKRDIQVSIEAQKAKAGGWIN